VDRPESLELTECLAALARDEDGASSRALALVYEELRRLARAQMARERPEHTLQPTALVHEAYVRLIGREHPGYENRAHFFGIAARAMRQILIEHARRRAAEKRGADPERVSLAEEAVGDTMPISFDVLDLHDALDRLGALDATLGRMVELRFFGGFTLDETAELLGLSRRKVAKDWAFARAWLARELSEEGRDG
jgi:RNA polymerase sigma factor (TIGR02999 family)